MADRLRLAPALRDEQAERDHLALRVIEPRARVVIAEAVLGQPAVDMARFLGTRLVEVGHILAEQVHLLPYARLQTRALRRGGLALKRQRHQAVLQQLVHRVQKRQHAAHAHVRRGLVHQLLHFHRRDAHVEGALRHGLEQVDGLRADERGQDGHHPRAVVQIVAGRHFAEGEVVHAFDELGIGARKRRIEPGEQTVAVSLRALSVFSSHIRLLLTCLLSRGHSTF